MRHRGSVRQDYKACAVCNSAAIPVYTIVALKKEKPSFGAPKIRGTDNKKISWRNTSSDKHGACDTGSDGWASRGGRRRQSWTGTPLSRPTHPNDQRCATIRGSSCSGNKLLLSIDDNILLDFFWLVRALSQCKKSTNYYVWACF